MVRTFLIVVVACTAWLPCGCHLIYPFGVVGAPDAGSDGPTRDADTGLDGAPRDGAPDAATDKGSDGPGPGKPKHVWHRALGGTANDYGVGVSLDSKGNVYLCGYFYGTADLGGGNATAKGQFDVYVTSFDPAGKHRWSRTIGGADYDLNSALAVDGADNVYLVGHFYKAADLGGGTVTSTGGFDIYVTSFTSNGTYRWHKVLGGTGPDDALDVAVDGSGNVYLVGYYQGVAGLGGGNATPYGNLDIFVTSFSSAGTHRWQKGLGGTGSDKATGVAVDGSGNVYLAGYFYDTAGLGGGKVTAKAMSDAFVTSFSSTGTHRWQKALGGLSNDAANDVAVDSSGNVYLVGTTLGAADLGGGNTTPKGGQDTFVTSFTAAGTHRWQKVLGGSSAETSYSVTADSGGNIILAGIFKDTSDLGGGSVTSKGLYDSFVTSFTAAGKHRWQVTLGGAAGDFAMEAVADSAGNVYVGGYFSGATDLGGGPVAHKGNMDPFVVKLAP